MNADNRRNKQQLWSFSKIILISSLLIAFNSNFKSLNSVSAHGHSHDGHGHSHEAEENPSYKWSRAANKQEDEIMEEDIIDLPPKKGPTPKVVNQGHSHSEHSHSHGHSHGSHGHSHGGHGHSHGPPQKEPTPEEREKHRQRLHKEWDDDEEEDVGRNVWMQALGATALISAAPFFILFLIPLDNSQEKQWLLKITLSFASGGLLGDAFLHLIPHAMMAAYPVESEDGHGHSHSHGHSHGGGHSHGEGEEHAPHDMSVGLGVLAGILAFLAVEKFVRIMNGGSGGHGHSHAPASAPKKEEKKVDKKLKAEEKKDKDDKTETKSDDESKTKETTDKKSEKDNKDSSNEKQEKKETNKIEAIVEEKSEIKVAGVLNLFADGFHNFTDGLAIGASFAAGESVGLVTMMTILFHEIPHEIGDYAILIQSGFHPMKAIMLQSLTAIGAFSGCITALWAQGDDFGASGIILPFTAGGFIYIATVSVIPELLEGASSFRQSIYEIIALITGVYMMVIIAQYE